MQAAYQRCGLCSMKLGWDNRLPREWHINGIWYCKECARRKRKQNNPIKGSITKSTMAGKVVVVAHQLPGNHTQSACNGWNG